MTDIPAPGTPADVAAGMVDGILRAIREAVPDLLRSHGDYQHADAAAQIDIEAEAEYAVLVELVNRLLATGVRVEDLRLGGPASSTPVFKVTGIMPSR